MRIGIDARGVNKKLTGIGRFGVNLIKELSNIDNSNEYIIYKNPSMPQILPESRNFTEKIVEFPMYSLKEQFVFSNILKKDNLDVFHSLHNMLPVSYPGASIVTIHDIMAIAFLWFYKALPPVKKHLTFYYFKLFIRLSAIKAKKIIVPSRYTKNDVIKCLNLNEKKISICTCAVDNAFFFIDTTSKQQLFAKYQIKLPYFLYASNFKPYKNLKNLILAYEILNKKEKTLPGLVMVGQDDQHEKPLREFVKKLGLSEKVIFTGYVGTNELSLLMNQALFFVFPSIYEGFGLPVLEAMACGTPVITSNVTSLPEVAGDAALLVNPYEPQAIADGIEKLIADNKFRIGLINKGTDRVKLFSWKKMARETLKVYEEVYNKNI